MMKSFKISARLKDLIGRELITKNSVAIFELVKNSLDAHAKIVRVLFEDDRIVVTDDGKGMSQTDIFHKDSRQNRSLISVLGTPYSSTPHGTYRVR